MKFQMLACTVFDERTHRRMDNPKPICPINFFEVGGITSVGITCSQIFRLLWGEMGLYE